jgi:glutathione synthase/RimK-type ligase-like ATP-grasp enzyme
MREWVDACARVFGGLDILGLDFLHCQHSDKLYILELNDTGTPTFAEEEEEEEEEDYEEEEWNRGRKKKRLTMNATVATLFQLYSNAFVILWKSM